MVGGLIYILTEAIDSNNRLNAVLMMSRRSCCSQQLHKC